MINMVNFFARSAGIELENCEGPGKFLRSYYSPKWSTF